MAEQPRLQWFVAHWNRFWFSATSPSNLGLCRILFFALFFRLYGFRDYTLWADVDHIFWMPGQLFDLLHLSPLPREGLAGLALLWKLSMLTSLLGLYTRASTTIAFLLAVYFLGLPHNFGKIHHSDALGLLIFGTMAIARCGDAWSLDARRRRKRGLSAYVPSGEYRWPVQLVRVLMVVVFFAAGVAKLRVSGLDWALSENLRYTIIWHHYNFEPPFDWGLRLAQHNGFCQALGLASLALELLAPLALLGPRWRTVLVPALYLMQLGFWWLMGISFPPYLFCYYLFWLPWDRLLAPLLRGRTRLQAAPR